MSSAVVYDLDHLNGYWLLSHSPPIVAGTVDALYLPLFVQLLKWFPMMFGFRTW